MDSAERVPAGEGPTGTSDVDSATPLPPDFMRAQLAQFVSLLADHSLMWILMWWLLVTRKNATADEAVALAAPSLLVSLVLLPLAGTLADHRERKRILVAACLVRALCHAAVAAMLYTGTLSVSRGLPFLLLSAGAGVFFDAGFTPMLPQLVSSSQAERALDYSLALPRAGYFITGFILLLLLAILGTRTVCLLGVVFLLIAALITASIQSNTRPSPDAAQPPSAGLLGVLHALLAGPKTLLGTPKLVFAALLSMLANFVTYPLFWLGPSALLKSHKLPKTLPESIEVTLVLGVVLGAIATPRLCRRVAAEKVAAASLLGMAAGLLGLGFLQTEQALYLIAATLGFALVQITGLSGGSATLSAPDSHRARIGALVLVLFELGGELGGYILRPLIAQHGLPTVLTALAISLCALGLPWLIAPSRRLPAWLRL
ncbi:MAG: MFS transporter [Myxococcales bacterium]|nr:MFS transporter [Myxococcales bacterium]